MSKKLNSFSEYLVQISNKTDAIKLYETAIKHLDRYYQNLKGDYTHNTFSKQERLQVIEVVLKNPNFIKRNVSMLREIKNISDSVENSEDFVDIYKIIESNPALLSVQKSIEKEFQEKIEQAEKSAKYISPLPKTKFKQVVYTKYNNEPIFFGTTEKAIEKGIVLLKNKNDIYLVKNTIQLEDENGDFLQEVDTIEEATMSENCGGEKRVNNLTEYSDEGEYLIDLTQSQNLKNLLWLEFQHEFDNFLLEVNKK